MTNNSSTVANTTIVEPPVNVNKTVAAPKNEAATPEVVISPQNVSLSQTIKSAIVGATNQTKQAEKLIVSAIEKEVTEKVKA